VVLPGSSEAAQICTVQSGKAIARRVEKRGNGCKGYSGQTLHPFEMAPSIYAARCGAAIVIHPIRMFSCLARPHTCGWGNYGAGSC
jgi:hypothetical protein